MEWPEKETLRLIEAYKKRSLLWDLKHRFHYHKKRRNDAWNELSAELNRSTEECKRKWEGLLASFRREKVKMRKVLMRADEDYITSWYAFKPLQFLLNRNKPKNSLIIKDEMQNNADTEINLQLQSSMTETEMDNANVKENDLEAKFDSHRTEEKRDRREEQETVSGETNNKEYRKRKEREKEIRSKKRRKKEETRCLNAAFSHLNSSVASRIDDDSQIFGNLVAVKLRRYDPFTISSIQNAILQIFMNADRSYYSDCNTTQSSPYSQGNYFHLSRRQFQVTENSYRNNIDASESITSANHLSPDTMDQLIESSSYSSHHNRSP